MAEAVRSPVGRGKPEGALSQIHPVELLAQVLNGLIERTGIDPGIVDDVLVGCVTQSSEQSGNIGRMAWLAAGLPEHVPSVTIERKCGSGLQAVQFAAQGVIAGGYDVVIAAGVESMSRVPIGSNRQGADFHGPSVSARYEPGLVPQGVSAELVANKWDLGRDELDRFSARSHERAARAAQHGAFDRELIPVAAADAGAKAVDADETIRPSTTVEGLTKLKPVFGTDEMAERFPLIDWRITAGSSSQLADGASAILIVSEDAAERLDLTARARFVALSACGDDPLLMLTGPIPATRKVLKRSGLSIEEIDHFEVNEAFASVPLAWQREFGVDDEKLNPRGGAIALGHPLGATGCRLLTTMLHAIEDEEHRYGLQAVCEAGGMANGLIIERI